MYMFLYFFPDMCNLLGGGSRKYTHTHIFSPVPSPKNHIKVKKKQKTQDFNSNSDHIILSFLLQMSL